MCVKAYNEIHVCIYIYNELVNYKIAIFLLIRIKIKFRYKIINNFLA